jgi:putative transposase
MDQRREFVRLAMQEGVNRRALCRRFGISPTVGYKWLSRAASGDGDLADRSRRPAVSPMRSAAVIEARVVAVRDAHPSWGARKIARILARDVTPPSASTIHAILRRQGRIVAPPGGTARAFQRFEKEAPNVLWQMDFKGHVRLGNGTACHPLTMIDDHSRYALCVSACANEQSLTVQDRLTATFHRYGLPDAFFVDNGTPWGGSASARWTRLGVWLLKLGIDVIHSRPYHPQSRGKNERFHRTLKAEVLELQRFRDLAQMQRAFDVWRDLYNLERPHESLGFDAPVSRYRPSPRAMPSHPVEVRYDDGEVVRQVSSTKAYVSFKGRSWKVPQAFCGERLAIRPLDRDGRFGIFFAAHQVATIDLTNPQGVSHVSEQPSAMSPGCTSSPAMTATRSVTNAHGKLSRDLRLHMLLRLLGRHRRRHHLGNCDREVGPAHLAIVEALFDRRLHELEVGRDVEVARGVERRMADLENLLARGLAVHPGDLRQDRISHGLEGLRDQSRADDPRRIARAQRDHATPPALRHRQRKQIAQQVEDVLDVVVEADALGREGADPRAVVVGQADRPADAGVEAVVFRERRTDDSLPEIGFNQHQRLAVRRGALADRPDVERSMGPGGLREVLDDAGDVVVALDQQHVAGPKRGAQRVRVARRERFVARGRAFEIAGDALPEFFEHQVHDVSPDGLGAFAVYAEAGRLSLACVSRTSPHCVPI